MLFYTFCVNIGKHSKLNLLRVLFLLLKSMNKYIKKYKLICFTNFKIKYIPKKFNVEIRKYYDNTTSKIY